MEEYKISEQELERLIKENADLINHNEGYEVTDPREIPSLKEKLGVLYIRRDNLFMLYKELVEKERESSDEDQTLTYHALGGKITATTKRNYSVEVVRCSQCTKISNIRKAYPELDNIYINMFGCNGH